MTSEYAWMIGFAEPSINQKSLTPKNDAITKLAELALSEAKTGTFRFGYPFDEGNCYRGVHINCDGEESSNKDHLLKNGMNTHSLLPHYCRWFRDALNGENFYSQIWCLAEYYGKLEEIKMLTPKEYLPDCESDLEWVKKEGHTVGILQKPVEV